MTSKGQIIINPLTQRPVRVGSKTWIQLVKRNLVNDIVDDNILFRELPEDEMEEKIKELNQKLPQGTQAVRGRGKYASKIVKRNRPLTTAEITKNTVKKATKAVVENLDELDECNFNNMSDTLERLIMEELMNKKNKVVSNNAVSTEREDIEEEYEEEYEESD
jgi:hypothetical protein